MLTLRPPPWHNIVLCWMGLHARCCCFMSWCFCKIPTHFLPMLLTKCHLLTPFIHPIFCLMGRAKTMLYACWTYKPIAILGMLAIQLTSYIGIPITIFLLRGHTQKKLKFHSHKNVHVWFMRLFESLSLGRIYAWMISKIFITSLKNHLALSSSNFT